MVDDSWYPNYECYYYPWTSYGGNTANVAKLTCGAATRGGATACTISDLPSGATTSEWEFTDGISTVTPLTNPGTSWSGTAVKSGAVSVKVTSGSNQQTLSAFWTVIPRSGWAFSAVSPQKVANGAGSGDCSGQLPLLPNPPEPGSNMGHSCLSLGPVNYVTNTVAGGPNAVYKYNSSAGSNTSLYQWERVPDLDNTGSLFYTKQTGTYNASTNPGGCISGASLAAQTQRHEIGSVQGHWGFYKNAQHNPSNNYGTIIESKVGPPSQSTTEFQNELNAALNNARTNISNAYLVEPYGVDRDQHGIFLGWVNYPPAYNNCQ